MTATPDIRIGISGWQYEGWVGTFYPKGLSAKKELEFAAQHFNSIELNGSFYSLQKPQSFKNWSDQTPDDFVFSIKAPRFITHIRRLKDCEGPLANFCAQGILRLGKKLGPILWQLPPTFKFDPEILDGFLKLLPHTHKDAAKVAANHDRWMNARAWLEVETDAPLHHAVEIRHKSFANEEFIAILRKYGVALVVADTPQWPRLFDITAGFMYCRMHGSEKLYSSGYTPEALDDWAERILKWSHGEEASDGVKASASDGPKLSKRDVFIYFDNDLKVRAPYDAQALHQRIREITEQK
ncbi:MAG TPA: DUF72 domain-containing protein [Terracidiphilus sp.]|nr:DUF72 domain-containing protein [Terracidiphilus sp.]